jgi:nitrogen PTS system EIIA component
MNLKIKDLIELLGVSEKTIYRWLKEKKIPAYRIQNQYRFSRSEINEWLLANKINFTDKILDLAQSREPLSFAECIYRGTIDYNIEGTNVEEVIRNAVASIRTPRDLDKITIIDALLKREEMMSTGIGHGIAIPHPRTPIITDASETSVSICMLAQPVDFHTLDNTKVHTLFIVITANPKRHLEILSKISYICQKNDFRELLESRAPRHSITEFIEQTEKDWLSKAGTK